MVASVGIRVSNPIDGLCFAIKPSIQALIEVPSPTLQEALSLFQDFLDNPDCFNTFKANSNPDVDAAAFRAWHHPSGRNYENGVPIDVQIEP